MITEAALRGTPAVGFDVPGLRDSVSTGGPVCAPRSSTRRPMEPAEPIKAGPDDLP